MENKTILTTTQYLQLRNLELKAAQMSNVDLQKFTMEMYRQMLIQQNCYKELLKHKWGI